MAIHKDASHPGSLGYQPLGAASLQGCWGTREDSTVARRPGPEPAAEPVKRKRVALYAEITPEARRQLRILAAEQDTRIEALVAEALNLLFEKHGKPPVA